MARGQRRDVRGPLLGHRPARRSFAARPRRRRRRRGAGSAHRGGRRRARAPRRTGALPRHARRRKWRGLSGGGSAGGGGSGGGGRHFEATPVFLLRGGDQLRSRSAVEVLSLDVTAEALDEELEARLLELGRPLPSEVIIIRERHIIIIIIIIFHYSFIIAIMIVTNFLIIITVIVASHAILQGCDLRANVVGAKASPDRRRRRVNASVSSSYQQNHQLVLSILRFA